MLILYTYSQKEAFRVGMQLACVAGVERGRGNLGAHVSLWGALSRAPKFLLPLPLSTPATQASMQQVYQYVTNEATLIFKEGQLQKNIT